MDDAHVVRTPFERIHDVASDADDIGRTSARHYLRDAKLDAEQTRAEIIIHVEDDTAKIAHIRCSKPHRHVPMKRDPYTDERFHGGEQTGSIAFDQCTVEGPWRARIARASSAKRLASTFVLGNT
ncbi:MAG: hypothetical protein V4472_10620 [Pseudomonadota bacterium]